MLRQSQPEAAKELYDLAVENVSSRWKLYEYLASMPGNGGGNGSADPKPAPAAKEEK
jgi:hypothetical protein